MAHPLDHVLEHRARGAAPQRNRTEQSPVWLMLCTPLASTSSAAPVCTIAASITAQVRAVAVSTWIPGT